jgi:glutathione peroxidase
MRPHPATLCICLVACLGTDVPVLFGQASPATKPATALDFVVKDIDGKDVDLAQYKGKVVLVVNVASKCGFTKQYAGLEALYDQQKENGLVVLGFPANNFNGQEPGSDEEIKTFCTNTYGVTFPMMAKLSVKGEDKAPLYRYLTEPSTANEFAGEISWNFNKFLIGKDGKIVARYPSNVAPDDPKLVDAVKSALAR